MTAGSDTAEGMVQPVPLNKGLLAGTVHQAVFLKKHQAKSELYSFP